MEIAFKPVLSETTDLPARRDLFRWMSAAALGSLGPRRAFSQQMSAHTFTYKTAGSLPIQLDVYRADDSEKRPIVVWIHGGALIMGNRTGIPASIRKTLVDSGFAVASIDYRLAPETKLPQIIEDVTDSVRWIRENAARFNGDPSKVGVMGGSAGGYLTLVTGYKVKPRPLALVSLFGYGDLVGDWYSTPSPHPRHHDSKMSDVEAEKLLSGAPIADDRERHSGKGGPFYDRCRRSGTWPSVVSGGWDPHKEAAKFYPYMPLKNVSRDYPPTLLIHGDKDTDVPYEQSVMMAAELKRHRVEHELIRIEGAEHGFEGGDRAKIDVAYAHAMQFLKSKLQ